MFRFENIACLYALPIVLVLAALVYFLMQRKKKQLAQIGDPKLLDRLMVDRSTTKEWLKYGLWLLGITFLIIACSNPQWGTKKEKLKATAADIYIALDISRSMDARDISPSRLERSKKFVEELINTLKGDRIGLISFAGGAYLQIPLTSDYAAVQLYANAANTDQAGSQGTAIQEAIDLASKAFEDDTPHQRAIIVISDGEDHDDEAISTARAARENGLVTFAVGVGTTEGAMIPVMDRGRETYKKDDEGVPVTTKLNMELMQNLADAGGGNFYLVNQGSDAIKDLKARLDRLQKRDIEQNSFTEYNSYFQYFLFFGILCLLLEQITTQRKSGFNREGKKMWDF